MNSYEPYTGINGILMWILGVVVLLVLTIALASGLIYLDTLTGHVAGIDRSTIWVVSTILTVGAGLVIAIESYVNVLQLILIDGFSGISNPN